MAIPAWKLQLQQNIAKKKVEKIRQEEQRRIQLLPPWKRAAIEQQTQSKNVIIISNNSTSTNKSTPAVSSSSNNTSPSKTVDKSSHTNSINSANNNSSKPNVNRTVNIVPANQKSPSRVATSGSNVKETSPAASPSRLAFKNTGKSQSVDDGGGTTSRVRSFDKGVSDEHCISVHNNPFLRQEKKSIVSRTTSTGSVVGNRQKVQDSTSPSASTTGTPRVAWNSKSISNGVTLEQNGKSPTSGNNGTSAVTTKSSVPRNSIIIQKQTPSPSRDSPTRSKSSPSTKTQITIKPSPEPAKKEAEKPLDVRSSRDRERKLSVSEMLSRFGRAASHDEKERVRRQSSADSDPDSPRSKSSTRVESGRRRRERSPSPVRSRYRAPNNTKPRPKSTPVEISTSVILSAGRSPISSPQPVRRTTNGQANKAQAPKPPSTHISSKIVISRSPSKKAPAPIISVSDNSAPEKSIPVSKNTNTSALTAGEVVNLQRKQLDKSQDEVLTPPARRKQNLPASAIIDLSTAGPIQEASGKPPADPEQIAKEKAAATVPSQNNRKAYVRNGEENNIDKPKPNTVSSLLGSYGQKKYRAPSPLVKEAISNEAIPYPEDFRRPKTWQEKQQDKKEIPSTTLDKAKPEPAGTNQTDSSASRSDNDKPKTESIPIPRSGGSSLSPIPGRGDSSLSPIPNSISPIPKSVTVSPIPKNETPSPAAAQTLVNGDLSAEEVKKETTASNYQPGIGGASKESMEKAKLLKKVKKKVNYEVIGGNASTGKPSMQATKSGRNRTGSKLKLSFSNEEPEEFEYQSEQSLLAQYREHGEEVEEEEEEEEDGRHSSVSEDEDAVAAPKPSGFRDSVPKGTGGLQSYTPSYLRDLTPSMMREQQEAARRKEEEAKRQAAIPEPEPIYGDDDFSSGASSAAMLF